MIWNKQQTAEFLGWTEKTLDRKTNNTALGSRLGRIGGKGTGSHVGFSEQQVRTYKAQLDNTDGADRIELIDENKYDYLDAELSDNSDIQENTKIQKTVKPTNTSVSKIEKLDIQENSFAKDFENALLLPHKLLLTVSEARKLSGLPLGYVEKYKKKVGARNYIPKDLLPKMIENFLNGKT